MTVDGRSTGATGRSRPDEDCPSPAGVAPEGRPPPREIRVRGDAGVRHQWLPPGDYRRSPSDDHMVVLHLSGPHGTSRRLEGRAQEGVEVRGDLAVMPAGKGMEQTCFAPSEDVSAVLDGGFVRRVAAEAGTDPDRVEILDRFKTRDPQMERLMLSFLPELEAGALGGELYAESLATALAVHLLRDHSSLGDRAKRRVTREHEGGLPKRALRAATDYVGDNLTGDLALSDIAAQTNLSPHHFARLFRESTGLPPHRYVVRLRVERAKELLAKTDLTIGEVAVASGFSHHQHLARHLKRLTGLSPGEFRRQNSR